MYAVTQLLCLCPTGEILQSGLCDPTDANRDSAFTEAHSTLLLAPSRRLSAALAHVMHAVIHPATSLPTELLSLCTWVCVHAGMCVLFLGYGSRGRR